MSLLFLMQSLEALEMRHHIVQDLNGEQLGQGWWRWTDQGLGLAHWHMGSDSLRRWR